MGLMVNLGSGFVVTTELGPVKGALFEDSLEKAKGYAALDGINVHDCPMGNLRINAISMGSLIQRELGIEAIPHFTCRDRSLLGTQADLLGAHALGIRHLLVTTGDPPKHGPYPSKPVYDYNTLELVKLIKNAKWSFQLLPLFYGRTWLSCSVISVAPIFIRTLRNPYRQMVWPARVKALRTVLFHGPGLA